ncbi:MAG: SGNH/GDSL hydrolase family protein [Bifidobacteriaceae bacterium]|nr:SGNH/GDSL hydrolase family protein [Bifidobacteriaceae bacterium]
MVSWSRYVAIGDSFTEGLWDGPEDGSSPPRGWADRLAGALSARRDDAGAGPIEYANLAIRGRLLEPILAGQLPRALALGPDLVSIVGGGNDVLRVTADVDALIARMDRAVARIRATGADVLLATSADPAGSPLIRATRGRAAVYYASIWSIAQRHGARVVDLWGMRSLRDLRLWAPDRIHLTPDGHRRVANAALVALGLGPDDPDWDRPLPPAPRLTAVQRRRADAAWFTGHTVPWAMRHLRGYSSGDGRPPKLPEPVPAPAARAR